MTSEDIKHQLINTSRDRVYSWQYILWQYILCQLPETNGQIASTAQKPDFHLNNFGPSLISLVVSVDFKYHVHRTILTRPKLTRQGGLCIVLSSEGKTRSFYLISCHDSNPTWVAILKSLPDISGCFVSCVNTVVTRYQRAYPCHDVPGLKIAHTSILPS